MTDFIWLGPKILITDLSVSLVGTYIKNTCLDSTCRNHKIKCPSYYRFCGVCGSSLELFSEQIVIQEPLSKKWTYLSVEKVPSNQELIVYSDGVDEWLVPKLFEGIQPGAGLLSIKKEFSQFSKDQIDTMMHLFKTNYHQELTKVANYCEDLEHRISWGLIKNIQIGDF